MHIRINFYTLLKVFAFTKEIPNGKLHFLCSDIFSVQSIPAYELNTRIYELQFVYSRIQVIYGTRMTR